MHSSHSKFRNLILKQMGNVCAIAGVQSVPDQVPGE